MGWSRAGAGGLPSVESINTLRDVWEGKEMERRRDEGAFTFCSMYFCLAAFFFFFYNQHEFMLYLCNDKRERDAWLAEMSRGLMCTFPLAFCFSWTRDRL